MGASLKLILALAASLAWPLDARAEDAAPASATPCKGKVLPGADAAAARAGGMRNAEGLLWRVERPGLVPSFLFGTIHSSDPSAIAVARKAAENVKGAKIVATELGGPFDAYAKGEMAAALLVKAIDKEQDTFAAFGSPKDAELAEKYVVEHHMSLELAHHFRLWFLGAVLGLPSCEVERQKLEMPDVDGLIAQSGVDAGVKVIGLETVEEQAAVLASISPRTGAEVLLGAARRPELADDGYVTLLAMYKAGRPAEILRVIDAVAELTPAERAAQKEFIAALLVGRNAIMAARAKPLLDAGGAFVAVGALHLPGKDGLVERVRAMGFRVEKVW